MNENVKNFKNEPFEEMMQKVGYNGRFQLAFYIFFVASTIATSLIYMNIILALNIPDHWCHVPGRNETNLTEIEWKRLTLPKEKNNKGEDSFSSCQMYNISNHVITSKYLDQNYTKTECMYGYEYDTQYYDESIPTKENWVCDKELFVTNIFIANRIVKIIGSAVLGYIGDAYGRQIVFCLSVGVAILGRILSIITTSSFTMFLPATSLALLTITGLFQMPYIIGMEISDERSRANIALYAMIGWSISTCLLAFVYWLTRHWYSFMWITTIPLIFILIFSKFMIESPRWLISQKKFPKALAQFRKIAKMNGKNLDMTSNELQEMFSHVEVEKMYGFASLFSHWRIAKNTVIIEFSWCVVGVSYFTLTLFSAQMGGNPFLNFFLQSIVEIPGMFIGRYLSNTIGRRLTNFCFFLLSGAVCIPIIFLASNSKYQVFIIALTILVKFLNCVSSFAASLQEIEMYPTCLRSSGMSLGSILTNAVSCLSPYFVYLGTNVDMRAPYYILSTLFVLGGLVAMFLPETLYQKLPDTMEEAKHFGKDQKFWSIPSSKVKEINKTEMELLNKSTNKS